MIKLIWLMVFCVGLSVGRMWYTDSTEYLFMNWNLFLALVPIVISSFLVAYEAIYPRVLLVFALLAWLLFFPNGPYLVTDLLHLRDHRKSPLIWYDLILFFSYAYLGVHLAVESARQVETVLRRYLRVWLARMLMVFVFFCVAFGVYLGRFLRFNSWDLFYKPLNILASIGECLSNPAENGRAYAMTLFFGVMLCLVYFTGATRSKAEKVSKDTQ